MSTHPRPVLLRVTVLILLPATGAAQVPAASPAATVKLSGYVQAREVYQDRVGLTGTLNRVRLAASGGVAGNVTWRVQGEFRTGSVGTGKASVSLQDAYVRWVRSGIGLQLGQFK